jgi:hypothetical protein
MNIKRILVGSLTAFSATLITCAVVTLMWNLYLHRRTTIDWATSFRFAIVLGIILPWIAMRIPRNK